MQGRTAAAQLAEALVAAGASIDVALVSSAVRAQQTWKRMADAFAGAETRVVEALYETHVGGVLAELTALGDVGCVAGRTRVQHQGAPTRRARNADGLRGTAGF